MKKDVLTGTNESVPKSAQSKGSGSVIVRSRAALPKKGGPLIPMKTEFYLNDDLDF
ncbi:MAG: hypothetical protein LBQ71_12780 [Hungatella sp.]|jgi:hypothetical protein|nr:hypothetical protein [Hungatella sp.]